MVMSHVFEPAISSLPIVGKTGRFPVRRIYCAGEAYLVSGAGYAPEGAFSTDGGAPGFAHPAAVELEGQADVLGGGERRDEVEILEHHSDPAAT
mgnify:CR=1 FL=1